MSKIISDLIFVLNLMKRYTHVFFLQKESGHLKVSLRKIIITRPLQIRFENKHPNIYLLEYILSLDWDIFSVSLQCNTLLSIRLMLGRER